MVRRFVVPVVVVSWLMFLVAPVAWLFAPPATVDQAWRTGLPEAFVELLGERWGRWAFSGIWIALNAAVAWRLLISKAPHDVGPSLDLDD